MTTFTWLGLVVIVAVAAFILGTLFTKKQLQQDKLEQQAKQAKDELEQYRQDVADHLANTKKLMGKMQDSYGQLLTHVEETNQILLTEKVNHLHDPFFSKETTEQLHASLHSRPERRRTDKQADTTLQPTDYATTNSDLLSAEEAKKKQTSIS
jgi:uncharacterized protein